MKKFTEIITPCPEMDIGLGVPRFPVRLVLDDDNLKLIQHETHKDCTDDLKSFIRKTSS